MAANQGIAHVKLDFPPEDEQEVAFEHADLVFNNVDHSDMSYEVRVFLNNLSANDKTPRRRENGYAGRFVVFGHGGCMGESGHCDAKNSVRVSYDPIRKHPLAPQKRTVTITESLRKLLDNRQRLETVTLVTVSKNPLRKNRALNSDLFKHDSVTLETY